MEPLSPTHPSAPTTTQTEHEQQKLINRETSIVELPPPPSKLSIPQEQQQETANSQTNGVDANVDPHDAPTPHKPADRGASARPASSDAASPAPAISTPKLATTTSLSTSDSNNTFDSVQQYSPTKTEIDNHPIRQRLSVHGDHVAASGWGTRNEGDEEEGIGAELGEEQCQEELQKRKKSEGSAAGKMSEVKEGDKVAWNWGGGAPGGTASEVVTDGDAKMVSHRGNEVKKKGSPENPAVHIERSGNDVVKKASELEVQEEGPKHGEGEKKDEGEKEEKKDDDAEEKKEETNGESAKTGEKRSVDEANKDGAAEKAEKKDNKKPKANGEAKEPPKKKGRPAKSGGTGGAAKKDTKKKEPKAAATADGKPRRSGRNKS